MKSIHVPRKIKPPEVNLQLYIFSVSGDGRIMMYLKIKTKLH